MHTTRHAQVRMQQRGIPETLVDLVLEEGSPTPRPGGARLYQVRTRDIKAMESRLRQLMKRLERLRHKGVIVSADGSVITVCHTPR